MRNSDDAAPARPAAGPAPRDGGITWSAGPSGPGGTEGYLADLVVLTGRVLAVDGGLPLAADPAFLRSRHLGPDVSTVAVRAPGGRLIAAGAVRPTSADAGATFTGLVDPEARGHGIGSALLDWGLSEAERRGGPTTVESESVTPAVAALFATRGLHPSFAEEIMRFDLTAHALPAVVWPAGTALLQWSDGTAPRFHAVYDAAFRDRPGFPNLSARQWMTDTTQDDGFRPDWSVLATHPDQGDVGFVTAATGWIVQVGVVPGARRLGLGAALVGEVLSRMRAAGAGQVLLDVNVDNPARHLYRRLGFTVRGRRARFRR